MKFTPKSEKELAEQNMIPDGVYPFEVINALDTKSKTTGNDMIAIQLRIFGPDNAEPVLKDYLLESYMRKIFNFSKVTGLSANYHAGSLCAADCVGKQGYAKIGTEKGKEKQTAAGVCTGEFYPDKNTVRDYVVQPSAPPSPARPQPTEAQMNNTAPAPAGASKAAGPDEDVPF